MNGTEIDASSMRKQAEELIEESESESAFFLILHGLTVPASLDL